MNSTTSQNQITRRDILKSGVLAGAALATGSVLQAGEKKDPYGGFKMGVQSYSLRGFDVAEALKHTKTLGLSYWEAYPRHLPMSSVPKNIKEHKKNLAGSGVTLISYGVLGFDAHESKARQAFDFAKAMGIKALSANPKKDKATFDLLDKLCDEYQVGIGIHNHGPKATYDKIDDTVNMVKDRHPLVGACVDTGHYLRSSEDPVEALERLKDRLYGVHLKDVKNTNIFKILGEGDLDVLGCLKVLKKIDYKYCLSLEYEENPKNPLSDIEACLRTVRQAVKKLE